MEAEKKWVDVNYKELHDNLILKVKRGPLFRKLSPGMIVEKE